LTTQSSRLSPLSDLASVREFQFEPSNLGESREHRLRCVFHEEVVSFGLAADITFGEVARALRELVPKHWRTQTSRSSPNSSTWREGAHPIVARHPTNARHNPRSFRAKRARKPPQELRLFFGVSESCPGSPRTCLASPAIREASVGPLLCERAIRSAIPSGAKTNQRTRSNGSSSLLTRPPRRS
jgi:hypothetical protein